MQKKAAFLMQMVCILILLAAKLAFADSAKVVFTENGHSYQRFDTIMTWSSAKSYCESLGGYLATVTSASEDSFVNSLAWSGTPGTSQGAWLGATDEAYQGNWTWVTGEVWSYTNWAAGEPNSAVGGTENYLTYHWKYPSKWNDVVATSGVGLLCEWDAACSQSELDASYQQGYNAGNSAGYSSGVQAGKNACKNNPASCGITVSTGFTQTDIDNSYNSGLQAGKTACQADPSSCGIATTCPTGNLCAYYDLFTNSFHIPCFTNAGINYWVDLAVHSNEPVLLNVKNAGVAQ